MTCLTAVFSGHGLFRTIFQRDENPEASTTINDD